MSTMVKIEVNDINDNAAVFVPNIYNETLQINDLLGKTIVIVNCQCTICGFWCVLISCMCYCSWQ